MRKNSQNEKKIYKENIAREIRKELNKTLSLCGGKYFGNEKDRENAGCRRGKKEKIKGKKERRRVIYCTVYSTVEPQGADPPSYKSATAGRNHLK